MKPRILCYLLILALGLLGAIGLGLMPGSGSRGAARPVAAASSHDNSDNSGSDNSGSDNSGSDNSGDNSGSDNSGNSSSKQATETPTVKPTRTPPGGAAASDQSPAAGAQSQPVAVAAPPAEGPCFFAFGFKALHDLIPEKVGACVTNETHNPANGDGLQQTTGGLLVWRKADNWTAFTDGATTWLNGPNGLQSRPNAGPPFPWEGQAPAAGAASADPAAATGPILAPAPAPAPVATAARSTAAAATPTPTPTDKGDDQASGPIQKNPAEIALGLGDVGKEIYQSYLKNESDGRGTWAEIRFARTADQYANRVGPLKIVNRVYVARNVNRAMAIYKEEVGKQNAMPESDVKLGGRLAKYETVGSVFPNEGAKAPENVGEEQVSHAACNDDCNSANFDALHQRTVVRYQNVVAVLYFWGRNDQATTDQATEWLRKIGERMGSRSSPSGGESSGASGDDRPAAPSPPPPPSDAESDD